MVSPAKRRNCPPLSPIPTGLPSDIGSPLLRREVILEPQRPRRHEKTRFTSGGDLLRASEKTSLRRSAWPRGQLATTPTRRTRLRRETPWVNAPHGPSRPRAESADRRRLENSEERHSKDTRRLGGLASKSVKSEESSFRPAACWERRAPPSLEAKESHHTEARRPFAVLWPWLHDLISGRTTEDVPSCGHRPAPRSRHSADQDLPIQARITCSWVV